MPGKKSLIYVGDPMCSWCWGFVPVYSRVCDYFRDDFSFEMVMGGLRAGRNSVPLNFDLKMFLLNHWQEVQIRTGQKFNPDFLNKKNFLYDTEPGCRAVVAMQAISPALALPYFKLIQQKFYVESEDPTLEENLANWAVEFNLDAAEFLHYLKSEPIKTETCRHFMLAQRYGVIGFPTVIYKDEKCHQIISSGYASFESLQEKICMLTES